MNNQPAMKSSLAALKFDDNHVDYAKIEHHVNTSVQTVDECLNGISQMLLSSSHSL